MNSKNNDTLFARQGDVGFIATKIPKRAVRIHNRPFAVGEATGHSHRVAIADESCIEMYERDGEIYVRALRDATVVHEEHGPVQIPAGWEGEIRIAREHDEEQEFRRVMD